MFWGQIIGGRFGWFGRFGRRRARGDGCIFLSGMNGRVARGDSYEQTPSGGGGGGRYLPVGAAGLLFADAVEAVEEVALLGR